MLRVSVQSGVAKGDTVKVRAKARAELITLVVVMKKKAVSCSNKSEYKCDHESVWR